VAINKFSGGHKWVDRKIQVGDDSLVHRHCKNCGRDYMLSPVGEWSAVHVGVFTLDPLDKSTNRRWLSEKCPGRQLPEEMNDLRSYIKISSGS